MQIAVTHRLVDVNESRFIRSCSFVSVCFPQFAFLNFFPPLFNSLIFNCSPSTSLSAFLRYSAFVEFRAGCLWNRRRQRSAHLPAVLSPRFRSRQWNPPSIRWGRARAGCWSRWCSLPSAPFPQKLPVPHILPVFRRLRGNLPPVRRRSREKLGFRQCGGEFLEDGIPHIEMLLEPV